MKPKVLIVDDHPVTRAGIRYILELNGQFNIVGEAQNGVDAIKIVSVNEPDLVIMDITMPQVSGIEATRQITRNHPKVKIIALSIHSGQKFVKKMLNAGAAGYILKDEAPEELITAIEKIIKGDLYLSSGVTRVAIEKEENELEKKAPTILKTKLLRPNTLPSYLVRDRIINLLEKNVANPFSLISAGADYGKSVVVSQWLGQSNRLYAWISLDEEHNDFQIFLSYLVSSIEQAIPGSLKETAKFVFEDELPPYKDLLNIIFNDLCEIEKELVLVLDNYHKIYEVKIHQLIDEWLLFPPPSINMSIITRLDPPIQMNSLRLSGRMTEVRMDILSFTRKETEELFKQNLNIDLSSKTLDILYKKTEGWIIPIRLASKVMENANDIKKVLDNLEESLETVYDLLISELISRQPEKIQESVLFSSILNRFCAEILDEIYFKDKDLSGKEWIDFIHATDLFIIDLDTEKKWFRFNNLIQDLLQEQLNKKHKNKEINKYHVKASHWFDDNGFLEEAIDHAVIINDYKRAAEIIKEHRLDLLNSDNYFRLEQLQRKIPISIIESDLELILIESYIQLNYGNYIQLGELEEKMNLVINTLEKDSYVHAEFNFFIGFNSFFLKEDLPLAIKHVNQALEQVTESKHEQKGLFELHLMIFYQLAGDYDEVKQMYNMLIHQNLIPNRKNRIVQGFLVASMNQGYINEAERNFLNAISYARDSKMKDASGLAFYFSASILIRKGFLKKAIGYFREVVDIRSFMPSRVVMDAYAGLVITYNLMNEKSMAEGMIILLERYTAGLGDYNENYLWSIRIRYHMINQDYKVVKKLLPDYNPGVLDLILWLDVPEITYARALIFIGLRDNLKIAEKELTKLEAKAKDLHNKLHLLEVKILQSILYDKLGKNSEAKDALLNSLEISEAEDIVVFYVELGELFISLVNKLPNEIRNTSFIARIMKEINVHSTHKDKSAPKKTKNVLTPREMEVLEYVAEGLRNQEIANKLFNTEDTVKKHIYNMFQKMGVKSRLNLVSKAKEYGILEE
jgi:LuxR family maltose regulon positive regulatory protein